MLRPFLGLVSLVVVVLAGALLLRPDWRDRWLGGERPAATVETAGAGGEAKQAAAPASAQPPADATSAGADTGEGEAPASQSTAAAADTASAADASAGTADAGAGTLPGDATAAAGAERAGPAEEPAAQGTAAPEESPSFDVVRTEPDGEALLAGRASPGADVEILADGEVVARTKADAEGAYIAIPAEPLAAGRRELSVREAGAGKTGQQVAVDVGAAGEDEGTAEEETQIAAADFPGAEPDAAAAGQPADVESAAEQPAAAEPARTQPPGREAAAETADAGSPEAGEEANVAGAEEAAAVTASKPAAGGAEQEVASAAGEGAPSGAQPSDLTTSPAPEEQTATAKEPPDEAGDEPAAAAVPSVDDTDPGEADAMASAEATAPEESAPEIAPPEQRTGGRDAGGAEASGDLVAVPGQDEAQKPTQDIAAAASEPSAEQPEEDAGTSSGGSLGAEASADGGAPEAEAALVLPNVEAEQEIGIVAPPHASVAASAGVEVEAEAELVLPDIESEQEAAALALSSGSEAQPAEPADAGEENVPGTETAASSAKTFEPAAPDTSSEAASVTPPAEPDAAPADGDPTEDGEAGDNVGTGEQEQTEVAGVSPGTGEPTNDAQAGSGTGSAASSTEPDAASSTERPEEAAVTGAENEDEPTEEDGERLANAEPATGSGAAPAPQDAGSPAAASAPQPTPSELVIRAAEVEAETLYVAGEAPPGTLIRIYADEKFVGEVETNPKGAWLIEARRSVPTGKVVIRADAVRPDVPDPIARAELPFVRYPDGIVLEPAAAAFGTATAASAVLPPPTYVIIRRGDNLWRISRRSYGRGVRYEAIYSANRDQISDPHWIYPGQVFMMPTRDRNWATATN